MSATHQNSFRRGGMNSAPKSGFGRMLLLSLGLHLVTFLIFGTSGLFNSAPPPREVYHVDLLSLPAKKKPTPVVKRPVAPKVVKSVVKPAAPKPKAVVAKPKPKPKAVAIKPTKPEVKSPPVTSGPSDSELNTVQSRMDAIRRKQAIAENKARVNELKAGLAASDTATNEATGAAIADKIQQYVTGNWSFSKYQMQGDEVDALYWVKYNAGGEMVDFKRLSSSGNANFDLRANNAIIISKKLPFPLDKAQEFEILFEVEAIKKLLK